MLRALPKQILNRVTQHFLNPRFLLEEIDVRPGQQVLELGLPIGFFAPALLEKVGDDGNVFVAGPNHESLEKLAHLSYHDNLKLILLADVLMGKAAPLGSIDTVILTNLLSNSYHPDQFCLQLGQYLKADSRIILIDWDTKSANIGPAMEQRVSKEQAVRLLVSCGLDFIRVLNLPGYHYGLVFGFKPD